MDKTTCRYCNGMQTIKDPGHRQAGEISGAVPLCVLLREQGICPLQLEAGRTDANQHLADALNNLAAALRETGHPAAKPIVEILAADTNGRGR